MLQCELLDLVQTVQKVQSETQTTEVKAAHRGCPKRLYDTLSAFSNQEGGGVIVFGLDEENGFGVIGVYDAQDLQHKVNEQCKQMIPPIRPLFTVAEVSDCVVVSAEIPEIDLTEKPCYYAGVGRMKGSYIRVGTSDEPMTEYEIYSYEAFRKHRQDDIRKVERATLTSLNRLPLEGYVRTLKQEKTNLAAIDDEQLHELLSITHDTTPTLAAVMIFSPFPQAYFPQFSITAVAVPGYNTGELGSDGARFLDNRRIEGPIPKMLEEALTFAKKNMSVRTIVDSGTGRRADKPEYPLLAIREAVINALMHRDYSVYTEGTPIQIVFYKDRLEISNPGGLYGRLKLSDLGRTHADTRNPVLAGMLEVLRLAENRYSGIPTMIREMRDAELPPPEFFNERGTFRVVFRNSTDADSVATAPGATRPEHLVEFCSVPRSREEIADFLGLQTTYYATQKHVLPLVRDGRLAMTIPDRPRSRNQRFVAASSRRD